MKLRLAVLFCLPFLVFGDEYIFPLGELGSVRYRHENNLLHQIDRLSSDGEVIYSHVYHYDDQTRLVSESLIGGLGEIVYEAPYTVKSPYHMEVGEYDANGNLVKHTVDESIRVYSYTGQNELICEEANEKLVYDLDGNLIQKGEVFFTYDEHHKLIKVLSPSCEVTYGYDKEGNRVSKTSNGVIEKYAFAGINELALLDEKGELKQLRIPGIYPHPDKVKAIAIETPTAIYAPIHDIQGNILKLIDINSREVIALDLPDPFGRGLSDDLLTPWMYCGKHYDPETGLVYFGHRFYCPSIKSWLTPDPAFQTSDPYLYCFNNPLSFFDPDGKWAFTIPIVNFAIGAAGTVTFPIWGTAAIAAAGTAAVSYVGYKAVQSFNERLLLKEIDDQLSQTEITPNEKKTPGNLQSQIDKGKAPKSVERADKGRGKYEKDHIHFDDDSALNSDGTWKHGWRELTKYEAEWLRTNGWTPPKR